MKHNLIIAGPNRQKNLSWQQRLNGFVKTCITSDKLEMLGDDIARIRPVVFLLDFDLLKLDSLHAATYLNRLCTETKVIIFSGDISEDLEWELFMAGVRGYCNNSIRPKFLNKAVIAVLQGELWMRRSLTCRLTDEMDKTASINKDNCATTELLNILTQREYDIATCVGNGESNKKIAHSCDITERTVKAHLTEVYHKLGITGRLNLALIISADNHYQNRSALQLQ